MVTPVAASLPPPPPSSSSAGITCGPDLEFLKLIDLESFSQSELHALSLFTHSAVDVEDDHVVVVVPDVDRSTLNESAASRGETCFRLRQSHHYRHIHPRTRLHGTTPPSYVDAENRSILHYLKHYIGHNSTSDCPPPPPPPPLTPPPPQPVLPGEIQQQLGLGLQEKMAKAFREVKKRRKRVPKAKWDSSLVENGVEMELERVNKNGDEVDFAALESNGDELYDAELRRRTMGMETEEAFLGFLRGLEGQWCSRRKKRKYVDASQFGDCLPIGWKLLLAIRKHDGHFALCCRRIISPTGEQLLSCMEASLLLRSYFKAKTTNQQVDSENFSARKAGVVASGCNAGAVDNADHTSHEIGSNSSLACLTAFGAHLSDVCLMDIDNLPEVQVQDLFECYKCNLSFHQKNLYLQHVMSFHQQTTRRNKFGDTVGDGVIIKDGKFECQFCHKVFLERHSYTGHVGVHVRNHVKGSVELHIPDFLQNSESSSQERPCPRTSKMNALIETGQNSILAASSTELSSAAVDILCRSVVNLEGTLAGSSNHEMTLLADRTLNQEVNQQENECQIGDGRMINSNDMQTREINRKEICTTDAEQRDVKELNEHGNNDVEIGLRHQSSKRSDDIAKSDVLMGEEDVLQDAINPSLVPLVQSFDYLSCVSDKGDGEFFLDGQKLDNLPGFEELELNDMEAFRCDFAGGQESSSLPRVSIDVASDMGEGEELNASVGSDAKPVKVNMTGTHQFTTVCVWCRSEFKVEAIDSELQSDSIGYMCKPCKDRISGHFDRICR